ncbi:MAG: glutathione ABC transporter permease GsiC [Bilophila wadsworthia]
MLHYFLKRLLGLLPTLFLVAVIVFLFVHMLPGDPARLAAGPEADQVTVELVRKDLGLDKPLPEQFITYFGNITPGASAPPCDQRPVSVEIGERFAATFWLTSGAWSGRSSWADHRHDFSHKTQQMAGSRGDGACPDFRLCAAALAEIFPFRWAGCPLSDGLVETLYFAVHHAGGRSRCHGPVHSRVFVEILQDDYRPYGPRRGLSEWAVIVITACAMRSSPVVTMMGLQFGFLLGGSIVVGSIQLARPCGVCSWMP